MRTFLLICLLSVPVFAGQKYGFKDSHLDDEFANNYKEHTFPNWVNAKGSTATITYLNVSTISVRYFAPPIGINTSNVSQLGFHSLTISRDVAGPADHTANAQLGLTGSTSLLKQMVVGFDTTNNYGFLQAAIQGTSFNPITINPDGGAVNVHGTVTNDSAAAGFYGERVSAVAGFTNFPTTAQWGDLTSISLTAGDWDVTAMMTARNSGATGTNIQAGISTTSGNSATGLTFGDNEFGQLFPTAAVDSTITIAMHQVSLTATTTVYLKYFAGYSAGTPTGAGRLTARRVR